METCCDICKIGTVYDYDPPMCCSGRDCGCMGYPTEPAICEPCLKGEQKVVTIDRVKFIGKWVEFWFLEKDSFGENLSFDATSKQHYFWDAVDHAGVYDDVISYGVKGRKFLWKFVSPNWVIVGFLPITGATPKSLIP